MPAPPYYSPPSAAKPAARVALPSHLSLHVASMTLAPYYSPTSAARSKRVCGAAVRGEGAKALAPLRLTIRPLGGEVGGASGAAVLYVVVREASMTLAP